MSDLWKTARKARDRRRRWRRERERSIGENLAIAGTVGWLIVVPALLGAIAGRWLDRRFNTGVTFSAGLLILGVVIGCVLAWRAVRQQGDES